MDNDAAEMLGRAEAQLVLAAQAIDSAEKEAHDKDELSQWGTDFADSRIQLARHWIMLAGQTAHWTAEETRGEPVLGRVLVPSWANYGIDSNGWLWEFADESREVMRRVEFLDIMRPTLELVAEYPKLWTWYRSLA